MCSNNTSGFINKENVQPLSTICKLDASDLNVIQAAPRELKPVVNRHCDFLVYRDDEDSDSDDVGTADLLKVRKRRADSPPLLKPESLALNQKFYCDLNSIYINGYEYSFEEIRYRKWLNCRKEKAAKRSNKEMAKEIVNLKRKVESNEQAIQFLQDKLSTVMGLIQANKPANEDKQEVSTMVRDLINGSYNDTQLEKTMLQPIPSIPVKDFTIYKDMTIEAPTFVAPAQDNVPLIRFDITECGEAAKNLVSSSALSSSKGFDKSIDNQTFNLKKAEIDQKSLQTQISAENILEIKKSTFKIHEDSIENKPPALRIYEDSIENKEPTSQIYKDSIEIKKPPVLQIHEDSIENKEPTLQIYKDSIEIKKPASQIHEASIESKIPTLQIQEDSIEIKEPNLQIHEDSIEIKEPNCDFLDKFQAERHDPIDMEIEKAENKISQIKSALEDTKRKSLLARSNNKLSIIAENSRELTDKTTTDKNSPVKMRAPVAACKSMRNDFDLADLSVNPIIHRGSMHFRVSEAFTMYIPNSEDECVPKSCSTPGKTQ
uniref:Uncharacterized protein n=1 Tax=Tetranychus urticae TaxID=32264 RepID=T1KX54_TETUR